MKNNIKQFREAKGLTQKQLAEAVNENLCVIQTYEQNLRTPSLAKALKISKFLGVSVEELFAESQKETTTAELCEELSKRVGVQEIVGEPYETLKIEVDGKARQLDIVDGPFRVFVVYD